MKKVSIISPCYNGEQYLKNYLDSVLAQTYSNIELLLVDDGSTDSTELIAKEYISKFAEKQRMLIYLKQEINQGQAAAVNRGLAAFSGEYLTWMDSDDIYYPNAIEDKVKFLEENPDIDFMLNWGEIVNEFDLDAPIGYLRRKRPTGKDNLFVDLLKENNVVFGPGTIMVRADSFRKAIPTLHIYESRQGQNWQMMLPLAYSCKYGYLEKVLFKYVVHADSHSHTKRTYENEIKRRDDFHILKVETIKNIPSITEDEIVYWEKHDYFSELYNKYKLSLRYRKLNDYRKYKAELQENSYHILTKDRFFLFYAIAIARKVKKLIKRCCLKIPLFQKNK